MKTVFLDRDGVLNQAIIRDGKPYAPTSLSEMIIPEEVLPALLQLKAAGFLLIVATNQPDVIRGVTTKETVEAINRKLLNSLPLDDIMVCYHDDACGCACRKPKPGLLLQAAQRHNIDYIQSFMIGDRCKDIAAGFSAGCKTILLECGYNEPQCEPLPDYVATSIAHAVQWILH